MASADGRATFEQEHPRVNLGAWQLDTVDGGDLSLDGGVVFGIVPKVLWDKILPPDHNNRVHLRNSCVLARDGRHTVLIDTGYGGKYAPIDRKFYEMEDGEPLARSLTSLGVRYEDIDTVVFTHLHFDHVGGASRRDGQRRVVLTFPQARHVIGRVEWEDATSKLPELERAYPQEHIVPLAAAAKIDLIPGSGEILPGLRSIITGGHTRGHLALAFESQGETALIIGDICPTVHHLRRSWCLSYDTQVVETRRIKPKLLAEAAQGNWWIHLTHDPKFAAVRIAPHAQREFDIVEARERF
jgi:glyoxylase-like metal-dependent hydrolase (beta-lactamase superfamily II)